VLVFVQAEFFSSNTPHSHVHAIQTSRSPFPDDADGVHGASSDLI
jgi:hypothetical protein